jgi:predicted permease
MHKVRAIWIQLLGVMGLRHNSSEFDAELQSHLELAADDGVRRGLLPDEARRRALVQLGGAEQTRQALRDRATLPWIENLLRDLRFSFRTLVKNSATTTVAVLSIGLGIGANATIFAMVSRFVLRPAPVGDPTTLLTLHTMQRGQPCCNEFPYPVYSDVRDQARSFVSVAAYYELLPATVSGSSEPERVFGQAVTWNFFNVLELPMVLGRGFTNDEENTKAVVIGAGLWHRQFGSDPNIAGKAVTLSGRSFTVVGVAPASFHSVDQILYTQFWVPLGVLPQMAANAPTETTREQHWLAVVARLRPGVSRREAGAELDTLSGRFASSNPATDKGIGFVFEQAGSLPPRERTPVLLFLTALSTVVLLVLAIAAANVANLLFAQTAGRQKEMAVRLALGATRGRLRRQVLLECLLLGLAGGSLGVTLSLLAMRGLSTFHIPAPVPLDVSLGLDWRVLAYCFLLSVVCGILLGIPPAWAASRPMLANALKGEDALARPGRKISLRNVLVVGQVAIALVLLSVTGLFLRSMMSASTIDIGFHERNLLLGTVDPAADGYTPQRTLAFLVDLRQRVASLPGVESAVVTDVAPLTGGNRSDAFHVRGEPDSDATNVNTQLVMTSPGYFHAMGIPWLAGRDFIGETSTGPLVAIVNQAFADRLFGGHNPIGKQVTGGGTSFEIIGVCGNVKTRTLGEETSPVLYRSLSQASILDPSVFGYTLLVKTAGDPMGQSDAVRKTVRSIDGTMAVSNLQSMQEHIRSAYFLPRLAATLFGTFGAIGLALAAVGLFGVMSYSVSRRTREIGIRMALGAQPGTVERLILRQGFVLTLIALVLGWPAAWLLAKLASSFLYGIEPHDELTFAVVPVVLGLIALAACWIPAKRAASIDPMRTLRTE